MDRLLYVAMSGAKETLQAQAVNNHNLATASTTGFRADLAAFLSRPVAGPGFQSRVYATAGVDGWDPSQGALETTGRELDVALDGDGFIAVQAPDGTEAYTRAGDLRIQPDGLVTNGAGHPVLGDGGPLLIPPHTALTIGPDGTVSIVPVGQGPETISQIGRIKLVRAAPEDLEKAEGGLLKLRPGATANVDPNVRITSGALEASNVNIADAMVNMIELARRFELQVKMMRSAEDNGATTTQLLQAG
jgi:flagellar basal-body rod protein FlgF